MYYFFTKDSLEVYFSSSYLFLFTVIWEIATKINYVKIFLKLKINRHTVYIFQPSRLTSYDRESHYELMLSPCV